jgi:hypothetical protein
MEIGLEIIASVLMVVASVLAFWFALPKDGQVRGYLRNDQVQAYYAVALLGTFVGGLLFTTLGVMSLLD